MAKSVLLAHGDPAERSFLESAIKASGYGVIGAEDAPQALALLKGDRGSEICLVLFDLDLAGAGPMDLLAAARSLPCRPSTIAIAGPDCIDRIVSALRAGAVDFLVKPLTAERIEVSIKNALRIKALEVELARLQSASRGELGFGDLVAESEAMSRVVALGRRAARAAMPVLVEGESGVGKATIARAIHGESARAGKPFVAVHCGALPAADAERILFGSLPETPRDNERAGAKLSEADRGTLFLEEIGELPLSAQATLLDFLQPGGGPQSSAQRARLDVRLIAASTQNLIGLVQKGRFREDLYYRLTIFPIRIPPLRERLDDLPELLRRLIARFEAEEGKSVQGIAPDALNMLRSYPWPGNLTQLENAVFRAFALADGGLLSIEDFPQIAARTENRRTSASRPPHMASPLRMGAPAMLGAGAVSPATIPVLLPSGRGGIGIPALSEEGDIRSLEAVEADLIRLALGRYRGRMTEVAKRLGIGRSTLYRKMREIGLEIRGG